MDAGLPYPGSTRVEEVALNLCLERFDEFVGLPYSESLDEIETFFPTAGFVGRLETTEKSFALYDLEELYMEGSTCEAASDNSYGLEGNGPFGRTTESFVQVRPKYW